MTLRGQALQSPVQGLLKRKFDRRFAGAIPRDKKPNPSPREICLHREINVVFESHTLGWRSACNVTYKTYHMYNCRNHNLRSIWSWSTSAHRVLEYIVQVII